MISWPFLGSHPKNTVKKYSWKWARPWHIFYTLKMCYNQSINQSIKNAISFLYRARKNKPNISLNSVSSVLSISLLKSTLERSKLFLHFYLFSIKPIHPSYPTGCFCPDANRMFFCNHNTAVRKYSTILLKASDKDPLLERCLTACNDIML